MVLILVTSYKIILFSYLKEIKKRRLEDRARNLFLLQGWLITTLVVAQSVVIHLNPISVLFFKKVILNK